MTTCPAGQFLTEDAGVALCLPCPANSWKAGYNGLTGCTACPPNSGTQEKIGSTMETQCVCTRGFAGEPGVKSGAPTACTSCEIEGVSCFGGSDMEIRKGFWKSAGTWNVIKCRRDDACDTVQAVGFGDVVACGKGYAGPACGGCADGYMIQITTGECSECANYNPTTKIVVIIISIVLIALMAYMDMVNDTSLSKTEDGKIRSSKVVGAGEKKSQHIDNNAYAPVFRSAINYAQILSLFAFMATEYTKEMRGFLNVFQIFGFELAIDGWTGVSCSMSKTYHDKLLVTMLLPAILVVCTLILCFVIGMVRGAALTKDQFIRLILVSTCFLHPMVSSAVLTTFRYKIIDEGKYLAADTAVVYDSDMHKSWRSVSAAYAALFSFGYPILILWLITRAKTAFATGVGADVAQTRLGFFTRGFVMKYFYWEGVNMIRKMACIFCSVFILEIPLKAASILAVTLIFLVIHTVVQPYRLDAINIMETVAMLGIIFNCVSVMLSASGATNDGGIAQEYYDFASFTFFVANISALLAYLYLFTLITFSVLKNAKDAKAEETKGGEV